MLCSVLDVAGVPIELCATDPHRAVALLLGFSGFDETDDVPVASITVDDTTGSPPARPPLSELLEFRYWDESDGLVLTAPGLVLTVAGTTSRAQLSDPSATLVLEASLYLPLTWLLAPHGRFPVHGAGIVRDGRALLLLGQSGAGKSTLIAAALEAGWRALADDIVVVHRREGTFCMHGVHRIPAIPVELGGPVVASAERLDDPRNRAALPREVLTVGGHVLEGVVLITHADDPAGSLNHVDGHRVLPALMQSFAANIDRRLRAAFFELAVDVCRLPLWQLGHAADASARRARAAENLDICAASLAATST